MYVAIIPLEMILIKFIIEFVTNRKQLFDRVSLMGDYMIDHMKNQFNFYVSFLIYI